MGGVRGILLFGCHSGAIYQTGLFTGLVFDPRLGEKNTSSSNLEQICIQQEKSTVFWKQKQKNIYAGWKMKGHHPPMAPKSTAYSCEINKQE